MTYGLSVRAKVLSLCLFFLVQGFAQAAQQDSLCVTDAVVSVADSFHRPLPHGAQSSLGSNLEFKVPPGNAQHVSVILSNAKGIEVLAKDFSTLPPNSYVISFLNVRCAGVYFVRLMIGDQRFVRSIALLQTVPTVKSPQNVDLTSDTHALDGAWERRYDQTLVPAVSVPEDRPQLYTVAHHVTLELHQHAYKICWVRNGETKSGEENTFEGSFSLDGDTLRLLDPGSGVLSKSWHVQIHGDTLLLNHFPTGKDGHAVVQLRSPTAPSLILEGIYRRTRRE